VRGVEINNIEQYPLGWLQIKFQYSLTLYDNNHKI